MGSSRILAVAIGAGHVACGVFISRGCGKMLLEQFACESHGSYPSPDGRWDAGVARSLAAIAARPWARKSCSLIVPGHFALTKFVRIPAVAGEKLREAVAFAAEEHIPFPLDEIVWDFALVPDGESHFEVMLTAVKLEAMESLYSAADSAGLSVGSAMPPGLSLWHAFRHSHPEVAESVLVMDIGARSTQLLFAEAGRFRLRTLPLAGNALTELIAGGLGMEFASAEQLKVRVLSGRSELPMGSPERAAVQNAVTGFTARLQLEIVRSSIHCRRQTGAAPPVALYLTGGGSQIEDLPETLAANLKLRAVRFSPARTLDISAGARAAGAEGAAHILTNLIGVAAQAAASDVSKINLLPPGRVKAFRSRRRFPVLCAAAAAVVALLLPPIVYFQDAAGRSQGQTAGIEEQLMQLRSLERRHSENRRMLAHIEERVAAFQATRDSRSNWIECLAGIQDCLLDIGDVWIDRLQVVRPVRPEAERDRLPGAAEGNGGAEASKNLATRDGGDPPRMLLSGRLLDAANPLSRVSPESTVRVRRLFESFKELPFIDAVESERFDNTQHGLLRFDVTLTANPERAL